MWSRSKSILSVVLVALLVVGIAAFGQVYDRKETIYVSGAAWGPASTWNPFQPGSLANTTGTLGFVYETLYNYDPLTNEMIPWLAESGEWITDTSFEITLREGLQWSDGTPLTAEDVAYTMNLGATYDAIWFAPMFEYVMSVISIGDRIVRFDFTDSPLYQEFDNNLYNIPIVPKHLWEGRTEQDITIGANENPIGSGAYLYDRHESDRNIWIRNENWWAIDALGLYPAPRRIVDIRFSSNNVALGSVIKGEVDLSNNFLPGVAGLSDQGIITTYFEGAPYMLSANTAVLFLNTTIAPMDDAAFRQALAYAINVDDIVNVAYAQLVAAANPTGLLPSLSDYVDDDLVADLGWSYDPVTAAQILADNGYEDVDGDGYVEAPDGSDIALEVTCPSGWTDWMAAIAVISDSCKAVGINVEDVTPDYGAWNTQMQTGTFNMTLNNWAAMSNTPWTLYNLLFRHPIQDQMQSGNFGRYDNEELFDLVDALAAIQTTDIAAMQAACSDIQEVLLTEVPMIPLWYNGMWAQYSEAVWTNWPVDGANTPSRLPTTWSGYWQLGGLMMLCELEPVDP